MSGEQQPQHARQQQTVDVIMDSESERRNDPEHQHEEEEEQSEKNKKIEKAVLKYLQQKGYQKAIEALKSESSLLKSVSSAGELLTQSEQIQQSESGGEILYNYIASEETLGGRASSSRKFLHAYQALTDWVYSSLDIYKNELIQVLYPVFLHCYLKLVSQKYREEALKFLNKYKTQHVHFHYDEILILQSVQSPDIMKQNEFVQRLLKNKFVIRLSQASFELLMKFLEDPAELNLLSILNQYIKFKVYKGQPSLLAPAMSAETSLLTVEVEKNYKKQQLRKKRRRAAQISSGTISDSDSEESDEESSEHRKDEDFISKISRKKVYWETSNAYATSSYLSQEEPQSPPPTTTTTTTTTGVTSTSEQPKMGISTAIGGDTVTGTSDQQQDAQQLIKKKKSKKAMAQEEAEKQMRLLAMKSATPQAPSCCFYTFFNCRNELNTMEIAPNYYSKSSNPKGPIIAAGFNDSSIKCWNWEKIPKRKGGQTSLAKPSRLHDDDDDDDNDINRNDGDSDEDMTEKSSNRNGRRNNNNTENGDVDDDDDNNEIEIKNNRASKDEPYLSLLGHSGPVYGLSFSSDYRWLLSCSEDCTSRLWNLETGTNVVVYKGHQYSIWDVNFSPQDYLFATASHDRTARLWTTDRISPVRILAGHLSDVECVKFHPNSNYVATGSSDKTVRLWNVQSGECVRMFVGHYGSIHTLAFSTDGRYCASAGEDKNIFVWDLGTAKSIYQFKASHTAAINSLDFNFTGSLLASGSTDCSIRVLQVNKHHLEDSSTLLSSSSNGKSYPLSTNHKTSKSTTQTQQLTIQTFFTKKTPVYKVKFIEKDVLLAGGAFEY